MIVTLEEGLSPALDEVAEAAEPSHRFLRRAWFQAAVAAYSCRKPATLVARRSSGNAVIAVPLVALRPGVPLLRAVPGSYWPFRSFAIARDLREDEMTTFLLDRKSRRSLGPACRIGPVYQSDPAIQGLLNAAARSGWSVVSRRIATTFSMDLDRLHQDGDWPRGSTRKKLRYLEKQMATQGALEWQFVKGSEWSDAVLSSMLEIERRSWIGLRTNHSASKFLAEGHRQFWKAVAGAPVLGEHVRSSLLHVGGVPVAFSLDVEAGSTKYIVANSYDEAWARYSPGKLLAYRNLADARGRGIGNVDWGGGDSGYKENAGAEATTEIVDLLLMRGRILGRGLARSAAPIWQRSGAGATVQQ
jgi:hypothetical protein